MSADNPSPTDQLVAAFRAGTACQESALHGLGHWQMHYSAFVEQSIDDYLGALPGNPA